MNRPGMVTGADSGLHMWEQMYSMQSQNSIVDAVMPRKGRIVGSYIELAQTDGTSVKILAGLEVRD